MRTWTNFVQVCRSCGEKFRISKEGFADTAEMDMAVDPEITVALVIAGFEFCLDCAVGEFHAGEKEGL